MAAEPTEKPAPATLTPLEKALLAKGGFERQKDTEAFTKKHQATPYGEVDADNMPWIPKGYVALVQEILEEAVGDVGAADGKWGNRTHAAYETFCKEAGVEPGEVDFTDINHPSTKAFMAKAAEKAPKLNLQMLATYGEDRSAEWKRPQEGPRAAVPMLDDVRLAVARETEAKGFQKEALLRGPYIDDPSVTQDQALRRLPDAGGEQLWNHMMHGAPLPKANPKDHVQLLGATIQSVPPAFGTIAALGQEQSTSLEQIVENLRACGASGTSAAEQPSGPAACANTLVGDQALKQR